MNSLPANFWIGVVLLCALAMSAVLAPWFLRPRSRIDRRTAVIDFAKMRFAEIENDFKSGSLSADEYQDLTLEQQRRLLQEAGAEHLSPMPPRGRAWLLGFALCIPVAASIFYFYSGNWSDWQVQHLLEQSERDVQAGGDNRETLEKLRSALERSLSLHDDTDGRRRFMLAQLDMEFQRYGDAAEQYAWILKKFPDNASIVAQYAQARYLASNRQLRPDVIAQAQRALQLDPNQTTALGLLGIAAFERKDFAQALTHWRHLLRMLPPNSASRSMIEQGISEAQQQLGPDGFPGPKFIVSVSLSNELAQALPAGGVLFVFAKAVSGAPMPLAVARLDPSGLPLEVMLDNSMAMAPGMDLSSAKQIQIYARITASGQVRGEPGDLEGSSAPLDVADKTQKVALRIDRKL